MKRAVLGAVVTAALIAAGPATSASAYPTLTHLNVKVQPAFFYGLGYGYSTLETEHDGARAEIVITLRGQTVFKKAESGNIYDHYNWSCARTGTHVWTVTASDDEGHQLTRTGTLEVGRCTPWRSLRIDRRFALTTAIDIWRHPVFTDPTDRVSRARCSPQYGRRGTVALTWGCIVTHNTAYKECTDFVQVSRRRRVLFGYLYEELGGDYQVGRQISCRSL